MVQLAWMTTRLREQLEPRGRTLPSLPPNSYKQASPRAENKHERFRICKTTLSCEEQAPLKGRNKGHI